MSVTAIPQDVLEQEAEIEQIFRSLLPCGSDPTFLRLRCRQNDGQKEELGTWIMITALGIISIIAFYLLWTKG